MIRRPRIALAALLLIALGATLGAGADEIRVRSVFDGRALAPDNLAYTNAQGEVLSFTRLSFLLTDISVRTPNGRWTTGRSTHWLDPLNGRSTSTLADLPTGHLAAVRFFVGLDAERNNRMASGMKPDDPLNPLLNGLHWSWQGGYVFLAIEGLYIAGGTNTEGWSYHLARDPNRVAVECALHAIRREGESLDLEFDLARLFNGLSLERDGAITHSRDGDPLVPRLRENLANAFRASIGPVAVAAPTKQNQAVGRDLPAQWTPFPFRIPAIVPVPALPDDNPLITERVSLGERLFHDPILSRDGSVACANCHQPAHGFSDPARVSAGIGGRTGERQSMPLQNLAWKKHFFWDGRAPDLRSQIRVPIEHADEMGETLTNVCAKLAGIASYREAFGCAFADDAITPDRLLRALEAFALSRTEFDSRFDRALRGGPALTDQEKRGFELFMTEYDLRTGQRGADCFHCHGLPLVTDLQFHNNGLDAEPVDRGRERVTGRAADRGKFVTPSLRQVSATAPYMHDGRFATLEEVVRHYSEGVQRSPSLDPNLAKHPVGGIRLSTEDQQALVAFLRTL